MANRRLYVPTWHRLYKTPQWKALRRAHLAANPLCAICDQLGVTRAGTVADHVIPHKGNRALFFDPRNLQTLCKEHHDGVKQSWEKRRTPEIGLDGWPVGPFSTVH